MCLESNYGNAVSYRYITSREDILSGEPIIKGTRTPVRSIVEKWRLGNLLEDIVKGSPYLTLAQVFAAMSYYYDNQTEIDDYIERNRIPEELPYRGKNDYFCRLKSSKLKIK